MKFKLPISIIILLFCSTIKAQTTLDVIRASNYYSKAINAYRGGNHKVTLNHLKNAETNLKGKTNKDLEYLKIMSNYKLGNYKTAFNLVKVYFEKGYNERTQYFKNVETYRRRYNNSYDEDLTSIFVELESKYNVVTNTSVDGVIKNIINKIRNNRGNPASVIISKTQSSVRIAGKYLKRSKKVSKKINGYYILEYSWFNTMYDECSFTASFKENIQVTRVGYSSKMKYLGNKVGSSSCFYRNDSDRNYYKSYVRGNLKVTRGSFNSNFIAFDSEAKVIFERTENLNKLKQALRNASLY